MENIPADLLYVDTHEWIKKNDDGSVTIGITDHAQELLGDLVFIELPEVGGTVEVGNDCGVLESGKAASDIYAPLSGEVISINEDLQDTPELVNEDAYTAWLFTLKLDNIDDLNTLMSADDYANQLSDEDDS